jgi:hypothetical protein
MLMSLGVGLGVISISISIFLRLVSRGDSELAMSISTLAGLLFMFSWFAIFFAWQRVAKRLAKRVLVLGYTSRSQ